MVRTAAILLLAMLGHGLLMTSSAAASPCSPRAAPVAATGPFLHCPAHDAGCFTVLGVVKSSPPLLLLDGLVSAFPDHPPDVVPLRWTVAAPPCHPPNVVRALLQVYRN